MFRMRTTLTPESRGHEMAGGRTFIVVLAVLVATTVMGASAWGSDHDDVPSLDGVRPELDLLDFYAFPNPNDPTKMIFAVTFGHELPLGATAPDPCPDGAEFRLNIDNDSKFSSNNPLNVLETLGLVNPASIRPDEKIIIKCSTKGSVTVRGNHSRSFQGLRRNPSIESANLANPTNVNAMIYEFDRAAAVKALLAYMDVKSTRPRLSGKFQDQIGRPHSSDVINNFRAIDLDEYNSTEPKNHYKEFQVHPNVLQIDFQLPVGFPNGRSLQDDVADILERAIGGIDLDPGHDPTTDPPRTQPCVLSVFPFLCDPIGISSP